MKNMKINKIQSMLTLIMTFGINMPIYSCVITFTNDSPTEVLVISEKDAKAYKVGKNKTIKFGDAHVKARFKIFDKKPKARSFDLFCTCEQTACAGDGKPHVKYSDIAKHTKIMDLFSVEKVQRGTTGQNMTSQNATGPMGSMQGSTMNSSETMNH